MAIEKSQKYDYAIYYPVTGLEVRGSLSKLFIFKKYWYGQRIDRYHTPYNSKQEKQQLWRDYHRKGVDSWQGFSDEQKAVYNKMRYPPRNTGYARFLSMYLLDRSKYLA